MLYHDLVKTREHILDAANGVGHVIDAVGPIVHAVSKFLQLGLVLRILALQL